MRSARISFTSLMGRAKPRPSAETPEEEEKPDWEILMESREDAASEKGAAEAEGQVRFLENPLPLPKKHVKRVMDYSLSSVSQEDDFDYLVADDDDFDI